MQACARELGVVEQGFLLPPARALRGDPVSEQQSISQARGAAQTRAQRRRQRSVERHQQEKEQPEKRPRGREKEQHRGERRGADEWSSRSWSEASSDSEGASHRCSSPGAPASSSNTHSSALSRLAATWPRPARMCSFPRSRWPPDTRHSFLLAHVCSLALSPKSARLSPSPPCLSTHMPPYSLHTCLHPQEGWPATTAAVSPAKTAVFRKTAVLERLAKRDLRAASGLESLEVLEGCEVLGVSLEE
eukprot:503010-Rhodomonas_salina.2